MLIKSNSWINYSNASCNKAQYFSPSDQNWPLSVVGAWKAHNLKVGGTKPVGGGVLLKYEMLTIKGEHL